jgi:hypothetical protein
MVAIQPVTVARSNQLHITLRIHFVHYSDTPSSEIAFQPLLFRRARIFRTILLSQYTYHWQVQLCPSSLRHSSQNLSYQPRPLPGKAGLGCRELIRSGSTTKVRAFLQWYKLGTPDYSAVQPLIHSKAPEQRRAKKSPSGRPEVTKSNNQRICPYCFASQTPQWRSSTKGPHLCNACGLYEERCGVERPLSMIIRKRAEAKGRNFRWNCLRYHKNLL